MTQFNTLPSEVIWMIFSYVDSKSNLIQCKLTCKKWSTLTNQLLYKNIDLNIFNLRKADGFMEAVTNNSHLCDMVKSFTLNTSQTKDQLIVNKFLNALKFIVANCPQMTTIDSNLGSDKRFWKILSNTATTSSDNDNKRGLERITFLKTSGYNKKLYCETVLEYKATIKSLIFEYRVHEEEGKNEQELIEYFDMFKSLEHLTFKYKWRNNDFFTLDSIIPIHLKSLDLHTFTINGDTFLPKDHDIFDDMTNIRPCYRLSKLALGVICNSEASFKYLMLKFPNLKSLRMTNQMYEVPFHISKHTMVAFSKYLEGIKEFHVPNVIVSVENLTSDLFMQLAEEKKMVDNNDKSIYGLSIVIRDYIKNGNITKEIKNDRIESYKLEIEVTVSLGMKYLERTGTYLTELEILCHDNLELNSVFDQCPNLKVLKIESSTITIDTTAIKENNSSLKVLDLISCYVELEGFLDILQYLSGLRSFKLDGTIIEDGTLEKDINGLNIIAIAPWIECLEVSNGVFFPYEIVDMQDYTTPPESANSEPNKLQDILFSKHTAPIPPNVIPSVKTLCLTRKYGYKINVDLANIVASYPQLKCLKVERAKIPPNKIISKNFAVESLVLKGCVIHPDFYPNLSQSLPNLNSLHITMDDDSVLSQGPIVIDMSETSLQHFSYSFKTKNPTPEACLLKLSLAGKNNKQYYYSGSSHSNNDIIWMKECTPNEFSRLRDSNVLYAEVKFREFFPKGLRYIRVDSWSNSGFIIEGGNVFDTGTCSLVPSL